MHTPRIYTHIFSLLMIGESAKGRSSSGSVAPSYAPAESGAPATELDEEGSSPSAHFFTWPDAAATSAAKSDSFFWIPSPRL